MKDFDVVKSLLREHLVPGEDMPIDKEELVAMIQARSTDIKMRVLRRVGNEIQTYLIMLIPVLVVLFLRHGISARAIVGGVGVLAVVGPAITALSYKEYQMRSLPLHGTLRESLTALIAAIDSMTRAYMAAHMISIVIGVAVGEVFLFWQWGLSLESLAGLVAGIVVVAWCYLSGRRYLERTFGRYRLELAGCLRELEGT